MTKELNLSEEVEFEEIQSEEEDKEIETAGYKINTYGADLTIENLSQKIDLKEIIIPPFQRKYVWPKKKASKLIESFLLGLPVPQIFLYREEENQDLLVVDGQQRLKTINYFFKGVFDDQTVFSLVGVKECWEGKTYDSLNEIDKRKFKNFILRATIFEQVDPKDKTSIFEIFERLNTGGMALTQQEIRNCVIRGDINDFLNILNSNSDWRNLLNKELPDSRMRDIEMILRFFSLFYNWKNYEKPMKDFISDFMRLNKKIDKEKQHEMKSIFEDVVKKINKEIGVGAFKVKSGVNIALMDSLMVGIASVGTNNIINLDEKYKKIKDDHVFVELISKSTTDIDRVKGRIKMVKRILSE